MQVEAQAGDRLTADVVVVPIAEGGEPPGGAHERVRELVTSGEAGTDFGAVTVTSVDGQRLAIAGLGRRADADAVRTAVAGAARETRRIGGTLAYVVNDSLALNASEQARAAADGLVFGTYDTRKWRSREITGKKEFERLVIVGGDDNATAAAGRAARVATWANHSRDLSNAPPSSRRTASRSRRSTEAGSSSRAWARSRRSRRARTTSRG